MNLYQLICELVEVFCFQLNNSKREGVTMKKKAISVLLIFFVLFSFGCASWTTIKEKPALSDNFQYPERITQHEKFPAYLIDTKFSINGNDVNASQDFIERLLTNFNRTQLFSFVKKGVPETSNIKYYRLRFNCNERKDTNQGTAFVKGFFIGLTLFLLTPALPLTYDYDANMTLYATNWDGVTKEYSAKSSGTANFHLFANPVLAGGDVEAKVINANLNSLMNQMMRDGAFYSPVINSTYKSGDVKSQTKETTKPENEQLTNKDTQPKNDNVKSPPKNTKSEGIEEDLRKIMTK
jgi:hypothetical protein